MKYKYEIKKKEEKTEHKNWFYFIPMWHLSLSRSLIYIPLSLSPFPCDKNPHAHTRESKQS